MLLRTASIWLGIMLSGLSAWPQAPWRGPQPFLEDSRAVIDSLKGILPQASTQDHARILVQLAHVFTEIDTDKALAYARQAFSLSEDLHFVEGMADAQAELAFIYAHGAELAPAVHHAQEAEQGYVRLGKGADLAAVLGLRAELSLRLGACEEGEAYYVRARALYLQVGQPHAAAKLLNGLGDAYLCQAHSSKAIDTYEQALKQLGMLGDLTGLAGTYISLGNVYAQEGNQQEALDYYGRALGMYQALDDEQGLALTYSNLGRTYLSLDLPRKAEQAFEQARTHMGPPHDRNEQVVAANGLGISYLRNGQKARAEALLREVWQQALRQKDTLGACESLYNLAFLENEVGNRALAQHHGRQSLELAGRLGHAPLTLANLQLLYHLHKLEGEAKEALQYLERATRMEKEVMQKVEERLEQEMLVRFDTQRKEQMIRQKTLTLHHAEASKNRFLILSVCASLAALLLVGLVMLLHHRRQRMQLEMKAVTGKNDRLEEERAYIHESLSHKEHLLQSQLTHKQHLLQETRAAVWIIDGDYRLVDYNQHFVQACLQRFGKPFQKEEKAYLLAADMAKQRSWKRRYDQALAGKTRIWVDTYPTEFGKVFVESRCSPILNEQGRVLGATVFSHDITQLKTVTEQLKASKKELELFLYRSSHDLRRPLTTLQGLLNLIEIEHRASLNPQYLKLVHTTLEEMEKMLRKLQSVEVINEAEEAGVFEMGDVIAEVLEALKADLNLPQLNVSTSGDLHLPYRVSRSILHLILYNLIENALIFSRQVAEGAVAVRVSDLGKRLEVTVYDNGPGIPLKYQDRIFELFFKASNVSQGNGLGLYLVRKGTDRLKGQVSVSSVPGKGASFRLLLPK